MQTCSHCGGKVLVGDRFCAHCGTGQEEPAELAPSDAEENSPWKGVREELRAATTGKYEVGPILGQGGMAAVFSAREIRLSRRVAIKVMSPAIMLMPGMIERFHREAITVAGLSHP